MRKEGALRQAGLERGDTSKQRETTTDERRRVEVGQQHRNSSGLFYIAGVIRRGQTRVRVDTRANYYNF